MPYISLLKNISKSAILGLVLLYTFTISNQLTGIEEDRLNKPDRPIVSGRVSIRGAYTRYMIFSIGALLFAYSFGVELGAILFMLFGALHNFTNLSSFGPTKDLMSTIILTCGLHSSWRMGGGTSRRGLEWILCLFVNLLFSISIQDLRDVVGDAATGRHTTPLILGKPYGTFSSTREIINSAKVLYRSHLHLCVYVLDEGFDTPYTVFTEQSLVCIKGVCCTDYSDGHLLGGSCA